MKKNCCWVYYLEPDSNIIDKVNVVLELPNYATKKELEHATGIDTSDPPAKKDFTAFESEVNKVDNNKLVTVLTSLNNVKIKVDDLDVGRLKTVIVDLKKLSDVVDNEIVKNTKQNALHFFS